MTPPTPEQQAEDGLNRNISEGELRRIAHFIGGEQSAVQRLRELPPDLTVREAAYVLERLIRRQWAWLQEVTGEAAPSPFAEINVMGTGTGS